MSATEIQDVLDAFELLGDWDLRYRYLVELGEQMPAMPVADKVDGNRVKECMSLVHVAVRRSESDPERLDYAGDCDTAIIKGVVALLVGIFSGRSPGEIEDLDVDALFEGLHLQEHLSPNRHVGIYAIVGKMKAQAQALAR